MQATELMIGDYILVETDDNIFIADYICDIGYVPQWNELGVKTCKYGEEWLRESEIIPVPLTSAILEKNGFILKEGEIGMYGITTVPHYVRDDLPFEVFCDGEPFAIWFREPVNIGYVHELQHVLKLCGIYKEIVI